MNKTAHLVKAWRVRHRAAGLCTSCREPAVTGTMCQRHRVGLLESVGSEINPRFAMTPKGFAVAALLRRWKENGGNFHSFAPSEDDIRALMVPRLVETGS